MKMEMKKKSNRYYINTPRSRHGPKYSNHKKCLSMMMLKCIKQHLSYIWSSIHEKVKQHWDNEQDWDIKRTVAYKKIVHGIGAKLVSNWEQKMLYTKS